MTDKELQQQYRLCEQWNDPDQWDMLALEYHRRGYMLNARACFVKADELRGAAFAEALPAGALHAVASHR